MPTRPTFAQGLFRAVPAGLLALGLCVATLAFFIPAGAAEPVAPKEPGSERRAARKADLKARSEKGEVESSDPIAARRDWFLFQHRGQDGRIPWNARNDAIRQRDANLKSGRLLDPTGGTGIRSFGGAGTASPEILPGNLWVPVGPGPIDIGGQTWGGRATAIAIHPTDNNTVYVGGAQGGVWKTIDGGATWTPLTDKQASLAIGSIAIDPANPNTIYAGTGEASGSCDSYFGAGMLKSTDAGSTWTLLGQAQFENTSISRIVVDSTNSNTLWASNVSGAVGFVASSCYSAPTTELYGVWKSTDAGNTWTHVLGTSQTLGTSETTDLFQLPGSPLTLYAGIPGSGVWMSPDGGATWAIQTAGLPTTSVGRVEFGFTPGAPLNLYAAIENASSGGLLAIYRSSNGGTSWTTAASPPAPCSNYCWYCLTLDVAPDNSIYVGGADRLTRSVNTGTSWSSVYNSSIHPDFHDFAFGTNGTVWAANDGGIWVSTNNGATWTSKNNGLALNQFYGGASLHPTNPDFAIGGLQDNGTVKYSGTGTWLELYGGDGAYTAIDHTSPNNTWYVSYQYLSILKTTDGLNFNFRTSGISTANAAFIAPYVLCPGNAQVLIAGTDNVWKTTNGATSWTNNSPDPLFPGNPIISALAFAPSDATCSTYYAGTGSGTIARTNVAGGTTGWVTITANLGSTNRAITDVAVHPTDPNILYVSVSGFGGGHVFKTVNALSASPTWTQIDAGIPDIPAMSLLADPTDGNVVYLGTDIGMFRSTDGGASWAPFDNGLPNVAIYDIEGNAATGVIMAFTHGRSAWKLTNAAIGGPKEASPAGNMLAAKGAGSSVNVTYTPACGASEHTIYWGVTPVAGTLAWTNAACQRGISGATSFDPGTPPPGQAWYFVIVGQNATKEGSYGKSSAGTERPEAVAVGLCDKPRDLTGSCP